MVTRFITRVILLATLFSLTGCGVWNVGPDLPVLSDRQTPPQWLNDRSPWYSLDGQKVELYANYCGWDDERQEQLTHIEIGDKVNRMVMDADELILGTFFLFDNLYVDEPPGDYVTELADLLIAKKIENPSIRIVLILDLIHKGWGYRRSAVVDRLVQAGVDVFYSDLLGTRPAQRIGVVQAFHEVGRVADRATFGVAGLTADVLGRIPILLPGVELDGEVLTAASIANGALVKANHRKALVIKKHGEFEALTTSWNPHNASLLHENHALSVTGPLASYVYMVLREDVRQCIDLGRGHVDWADSSPPYRNGYLQQQLPPLPDSAWQPAPKTALRNGQRPTPEAAFATEGAIEPILIQWLNEVEPDDRVRIQMFYLARVPVVDAILDAAARTRHPIEILLDPNRVGINYEKDGTPNSQVADYLVERARLEHLNLEVRWYATRGEQNHAKAMTITNEATGKYLLTLGSANWTRKNLAGINFEDNVFIRHSPELNRQFNTLFDRQWGNEDEGIEYSVAWNDPRHNYHLHTGRDKWAVQARWGFLWPQFEPNGRPELLEQELVHW